MNQNALPPNNQKLPQSPQVEKPQGRPDAVARQLSARPVYPALEASSPLPLSGTAYASGRPQAAQVRQFQPHQPSVKAPPPVENNIQQLKPIPSKIGTTIRNLTPSPKPPKYATEKQQALSQTLLTIAIVVIALVAIAGWIFYFWAKSI